MRKKNKMEILKKMDQKPEVKSAVVIKTAIFSFNCPICGTTVPKGTNYQEDQGFKMCIKCG